MTERDDPLHIRSVEAIALEAPLPRPVLTPMMPIRSVVSLLVAVQDMDGVEGWGEIWCNFPRFGLRHRAELLHQVFAPALAGQRFSSPAAAWAQLQAKSRILRLQSGEPGPIAAVIAGLDIALHDLAAKRAGQPLWRKLGGHRGSVEAYASLGRAADVDATVTQCQTRGFQGFKLHSSGAIEEHLALLLPVRERLGDSAKLMLDVNASWDEHSARRTIGALAPLNLTWLEEPLPADASEQAWHDLAAAAPMPLAGGENLISDAMFDQAIAQGALRVLQPDLTKWGGFTGCIPLAKRAMAHGMRFCPHMFSGAVGLLASAHLLAASNSPDGLLEVGVGYNPLRDLLVEVALEQGRFTMGEGAGLGLSIDRSQLKRYRVGP